MTARALCEMTGFLDSVMALLVVTNTQGATYCKTLVGRVVHGVWETREDRVLGGCLPVRLLGWQQPRL